MIRASRWKRGEHSIMAFLSVLSSQGRMSPKTLAREALIRGFISGFLQPVLSFCTRSSYCTIIRSIERDGGRRLEGFAVSFVIASRHRCAASGETSDGALMQGNAAIHMENVR